MAKILISVVEDHNDVVEASDEFPPVVESHLVLDTFGVTWPELLEKFMGVLEDAQFYIDEDYRKAISDAIKAHQVKLLQELIANSRKMRDTK